MLVDFESPALRRVLRRWSAGTAERAPGARMTLDRDAPRARATAGCKTPTAATRANCGSLPSTSPASRTADSRAGRLPRTGAPDQRPSCVGSHAVSHHCSSSASRWNGCRRPSVGRHPPLQRRKTINPPERSLNGPPRSAEPVSRQYRAWCGATSRTRGTSFFMRRRSSASGGGDDSRGRCPVVATSVEHEDDHRHNCGKAVEAANRSANDVEEPQEDKRECRNDHRHRHLRGASPAVSSVAHPGDHRRRHPECLQDHEQTACSRIASAAVIPTALRKIVALTIIPAIIASPISRRSRRKPWAPGDRPVRWAAPAARHLAS